MFALTTVPKDLRLTAFLKIFKIPFKFSFTENQDFCWSSGKEMNATFHTQSSSTEACNSLERLFPGLPYGQQPSYLFRIWCCSVSGELGVWNRTCLFSPYLHSLSLTLSLLIAFVLLGERLKQRPWGLRKKQNKSLIKSYILSHNVSSFHSSEWGNISKWF